MKTCSFERCGRKVKAFGLCRGHYQQRRRGLAITPLYANYRLLASAGHRRRLGGPICLICDETLTGCHVPRYLRPNRHGYVGTVIKKKFVAIHRWAWEQENGPMPAGLVADHMCRNRACCNVDHIRAVTPAVNAVENSNGFAAINKAKTKCPRGHEYSLRGPDGSRLCRECIREATRRRRAKLRQERERAQGAL